MGGLQTKSMTSQRYRAAHKMAYMRYYDNVMTTTRWRLYSTSKLLDTRASVTAVLPAVGNKENWTHAKTIRLSAGVQLKAEPVHSHVPLPQGDR